MHSDPNTLTEGSIWKKMLLFALPILLGNIFQQFYNTFDSWVVGKYLGDTALAAVSSSWSLIHMLVGFFNGLAMGAGVVIARYYGAKDFRAMSTAIHTNVSFGLVAGLILTILGVAFTPAILRWMDTPETVLPQSIIYFRYYFCGAIFIVMYNIFVGILHAVGDSKHPLYYLMISTVVNIVLDLLLVGKFHMGVGAAAMATTISQGISALLCFLQLTRTAEPYKLRLRSIRFDFRSLKSIIHFGLPGGIQNSLTSLANVVIQSHINGFGDMAVAGCGSYSKIEGFAFLPITCFTMALSTFVGQNLGAHKFDRVKKGVAFGVTCCCLMAGAIGAFFYLCAPQLLSIFQGSAEVIDYGARHMRIMSAFYFLVAFSHCMAGTLRGAGKATVPMFTMLICWCVLRVTYVTIATSFVNRLETVSWSYPITWACSSIVLLVYFLKADWMHNFDRLDAKEARAS